MLPLSLFFYSFLYLDFPSASPLLPQTCLRLRSSARLQLSAAALSVHRPTSLFLLLSVHARSRGNADSRQTLAGKSSLTVQFVDGHFVESYYPTIENTFSKVIRYKGVDYATEIIDTAGQVCDRSLREEREAGGAVGTHQPHLQQGVDWSESFIHNEGREKEKDREREMQRRSNVARARPLWERRRG